MGEASCDGYEVAVKKIRIRDRIRETGVGA